MRGSDKESRTKYLEALRDGIGAQGLVLSIESVTRDTKFVLVPDPRNLRVARQAKRSARGRLAGPLHRNQAAYSLANESSAHHGKGGRHPRVPTLAKRLRMDPLKYTAISTIGKWNSSATTTNESKVRV